MVLINAVRAANNSISSLSPTAVFVGATSGIGLSAIKIILKNTTSPQIFIIGRSEPNLKDLQTLDSSATITFISAQISLLSEVSRVCTLISAQTSKLDFLWLSQGGLPPGHSLTSEGLNANFAVANYSRILFMQKLLPLLSQSAEPRVISILAAGEEGPINASDFGITSPKNHTFFPAMKQSVSMMSLAMRQLSSQNPKISFIHANPGAVATDVHQKLSASMPWYFSLPLNWIGIPLLHFFSWTPEEGGQFGVFEMTDPRFAASTGKSFWRVWDGEELKPKGVLEGYEGDGMQERVWEHTLGVFEKVLGT